MSKYCRVCDEEHEEEALANQHMDAYQELEKSKIQAQVEQGRAKEQYQKSKTA